MLANRTCQILNMNLTSIKLWTVICHLFLLLGLAFPALSNDKSDEGGFTWQGDLGLSLQHQTMIVDSLDEDDGEVSLALLLSGGIYYDKLFIESSPFSSQPLTVGYTLNETKSTMVNLVGMSWFAEISEGEQQQGNRLDGIKKRESAYEVGIEYLKQFKRSDLRIRALHDVMDRHNGFLLSLDHSRPVYKKDWLIIPSWGITYLSEDLVDYYYGVRPSEVRANRPLYSADSGWSLTGRIYIERPINDKWTMFGFASYSKFSNSITDSPITSVSNATHTLAVGVLWSF